MHKSFYLILLLYTSHFLSAQNDSESLLQEDAAWATGSITLSDNTILKGLIKYSDLEGFVAYQDGENRKLFTGKDIIWFEFRDDANVQRKFISILHHDPKTDTERFQIFESIREYKTFAILLRTGPLVVREKATIVNDPLYSAQTSEATRRSVFMNKEFSQVETIFLVGESGDIKPYIEVKKSELAAKHYAITGKRKKTKSKIVDEDLLAEFVTPEIYEKLKKYAEENKLLFKRKDDFMKIIQYYDTMIAK